MPTRQSRKNRPLTMSESLPGIDGWLQGASALFAHFHRQNPPLRLSEVARVVNPQVVPVLVSIQVG